MKKIFLFFFLTIFIFSCKDDEQITTINITAINSVVYRPTATNIYINMNGETVVLTGNNATYEDQKLIDSDKNVTVSSGDLSAYFTLELTNKSGKKIGELTNSNQSLTFKASDLQ